MLNKDVVITTLNCKVAHLATVVVHIEELLAVSARIVKNILEVLGTNHPAYSASGLSKYGLGNYIVAKRSVFLARLQNLADALAGAMLWYLNSSKIANSRHKVETVAYELWHNLSCILALWHAHDERNIGYTFVQHCLLVPLVLGSAVAVVGREVTIVFFQRS